jgi:hypothetical protein
MDGRAVGCVRAGRINFLLGLTPWIGLSRAKPDHVNQCGAGDDTRVVARGVRAQLDTALCHLVSHRCESSQKLEAP